MNDTIASNIRALREHRAWTQEHLAAAAGVDARTIQRAEQGRGISAETLLAVASALEASVDLLRFDARDEFARRYGVTRDQVTREFLEEKLKEHKAAFDTEYSTIRLTAVSASTDLTIVSEAEALLFNCSASCDDVQDLAAELKQYLFEMIELKGDLTSLQQRECVKQAYEFVKRLNLLGCVVSVAVQTRSIMIGEGSKVPLTTLVVVVVPEDEASELAAIPKRTAVDFGVM